MIHIDKVTEVVSTEFGMVRMIVYNNQTWYAAADITKALGYKNNCKTIRAHCNNNNIIKAKVNGKGQTLLFIEEKNLYRLIMSSKLKTADEFKNWIYNQ